MKNKKKLEDFVQDLKSNNNYENTFKIEIIATKQEVVVEIKNIIIKEINFEGITDNTYKRVYDKLIEYMIMAFTQKYKEHGKQI